MGSPDKLEDARNDLGFIECRIADIGRFDSPDLDKLIEDAAGYVMEAKDALKEALIVLRRVYPWAVNRDNVTIESTDNEITVTLEETEVH